MLLAAGCDGQREVKPFPDAAARAEAALREAGRSLFDVLSFHAEHHERQTLRDSYRREHDIYRLRFASEIRYLRDVRVRSRDETLERLRQPDATTKEIEQDIVWRRLLGSERHAQGSTQTVRSSAVFEATETGWRLVAIDGPELETH